MEQSAICPRVTVIMPAYRAGAYIEEAIRSVLAQTVTDWQLFVIDDCSDDRTCAIVEALAARDGRIHLLRNDRNMGAAASRNRGLELCRGTYIAFLDSDDLWHPEKLERQIALLERTGADLCYCAYAIIGADGTPVKKDYRVPSSVDLRGLLGENCIGCSTVLLRRESLSGRRFTTEYYHEDYILWLDLLRSGCSAVGCTEVLAKWRFAENSRSFRKGSSAKNRWRIYRHYLRLPLAQCALLFGRYALAGLKKYLH